MSFGKISPIGAGTCPLTNSVFTYSVQSGGSFPVIGTPITTESGIDITTESGVILIIELMPHNLITAENGNELTTESGYLILTES